MKGNGGVEGVRKVWRDGGRVEGGRELERYGGMNEGKEGRSGGS